MPDRKHRATAAAALAGALLASSPSRAAESPHRFAISAAFGVAALNVPDEVSHDHSEPGGVGIEGRAAYLYGFAHWFELGVSAAYTAVPQPGQAPFSAAIPAVQVSFITPRDAKVRFAWTMRVGGLWIQDEVGLLRADGSSFKRRLNYYGWASSFGPELRVRLTNERHLKLFADVAFGGSRRAALPPGTSNVWVSDTLGYAQAVLGVAVGWEL
jgi:hypothetical protein